MTTQLESETTQRPVSLRDLPTYALLTFVIITFAITWGIAGGYILFPEQAAASFGELGGLHPLFFIATWGPGIAGVVLVLAFGGLGGFRVFISRLFMWRGGAKWWLFTVVGIPVVFMVGSLLKGGALLADLPEEGIGAALLITLVLLFLGPVEEFGWRGIAQPLLQRWVAPIWAGLIIGAVWGLWHLPAFYLSGVVFAEWDFTTFFIGCATMAVLVTAIFNDTRGGLLLPIVFHWQLIIPFWPDAQPWDTWILLAVTVVVVWFKRDSMFSRNGAVTKVIPNSV